MSEQATETTAATEATATEAASDETKPKPTETVDYWKARSRDNEAKAKANAAAAQRLAEIEEANKTEAQKAADRIAAAEKAAADAQRAALRFKIAAKFQIGDEDADLFLTGDDEATLTKQAERLSARDADRKRNGNFVPREGTTSTNVDSDLREAARGLFGGG